MSQTVLEPPVAEEPHAGAVVPWRRPLLKSTLISKPVLPSNAINYVEAVLRSGWWGCGPVAQHLQAVAEDLYGGRQNVLATSSCTAAMHLALRAAGVGPGDEVIVPAFTYVSSAVVASFCGAEPVFADVDPETLTLTAETVEAALGPRTRAIVAVHYAGPAADFGPIQQLAAARGITVVEDAAHAFGSEREGQLVGTNAEFAAFSFAPTKQIASSGGGLLLFADGGRRDELNQLAFLGLKADTYKRTSAAGVSPIQAVARVGHKYKIDDLAAAVALASLERLDEIVDYRARLAERYHDRLSMLSRVQLMPHGTNTRISWYIFPIRVPREDRDGLRIRLAEHNIDSTVHYPSLLEQPAFRERRGAAPVAARESRRILSLPLHGNLSLDEVDRICDTIHGYFG